MELNKIRNFCIIAHIDHGKSTLADRLLEVTGTVSKEKLGEQFLDRNPVARKHGITIKLAPVRMAYRISKLKFQNSNFKTENSKLRMQGSKPESSLTWPETETAEYILNLIDTPGHVDFSYEVIRTLYACEGAVLLVDATKGIQAQTVANYNHAKEVGLKIIPVINKIDLPTADMEKVENEISDSFGFNKEDIMKISAKTGEGVLSLIEKIIEKIPPPAGSIDLPTQALVFDSVYDEHRGVVIFIKVKNGKIKKGDQIVFIQDKRPAIVLAAGFVNPNFTELPEIAAGEVGFIVTNIKDISLAKVGDTICLKDRQCAPLPGYTPLKPYVFLTLFPYSTSEFANLQKAFLKLRLTDSSISFKQDYSNFLGPGIRCGFLGLLHAQITIERIEDEFGVNVFAAPPSIEYIVDGNSISNPRDFDPSSKNIFEPYIRGEIYSPISCLGDLLDLIYKKRGEKEEIVYYPSQVRIIFVMPLSSIIYDFYDRLKSISSGFASFDYEFLEHRKSDLVKIDIALNNKIIPEFSFIVHNKESYDLARKIVLKLKDAIPKHQFVVSIQAKIGGRIIASDKISALSKNVIAKLSGGDYTRKTKLLEKQKEGKERLKIFGEVKVPKEAFLEVLKG